MNALNIIIISIFTWGAVLVSCKSDDANIPENSMQTLRFDFTPDTPEVTGSALETYLETNGQIKNLSGETITLEWKRIATSLPVNWQTQVCDPNFCYFPQVDNQSFSLLADSSGVLYSRFLPDSTIGVGTSTVVVWEIGDSLNTALSVTFEGIAN